ncbi:MAG TPA: ribosome assembly cofactor RimP [Bacteroidales bacterium]|nr:ribosome assembly cofactor RimP [Bacteroidales bacterium]
MIAEKQIKKIAEAQLKGTDKFLVAVLVKPGNRILVFIDSDTEVSVDDCIALSRTLEGQLDRDSEDFELMVSSAGLDQPFSQIRQYRKYLNRQVDILPLEGSKFTAILTGISDEGITFKKMTKKHKNKAAEAGEEQQLPFSAIKETKPAIQFGK